MYFFLRAAVEAVPKSTKKNDMVIRLCSGRASHCPTKLEIILLRSIQTVFVDISLDLRIDEL